MNVCMYVCMCVYVCMYVCICMFVCTCMHTHAKHVKDADQKHANETLQTLNRMSVVY